jgi:Tfp pilus assembly protein FimT
MTSRMRLHFRSRRAAFTLVEALMACVIAGIAAGIATPRIRAAMDALAVEGAARDVVNTFALARLAALRHGGAEVRIDSITVTLRAGGRTVRELHVAGAHGVHLRATTSLVRYAATGLGVGLSNGSVFLSRGAAADTVVISRLGRVRR